MPYIYAQAAALHGTDKVGSKQCVALVQHYAAAPNTGAWREGATVIGPGTVPVGVAIATFSGGRYASHGTGNHAAFLLSRDAGGIWVVDQWNDDTTKPKVSKRFIRRKGRSKSGQLVDPSNNADAYSVIE